MASAHTSRGALVLAVLLCGWPLPLAAQASLDVDRFDAAPDALGFLGVSGTRTPGSGRWTAAWFVTYGSDLLRVQPPGDGGEVSIVEHRYAGEFSAQVGLGGRGALALDVPLVLHQHGQRLADADPSLKTSAFADTRLSGRYRLLGDDADEEDAHRDGPGLALSLSIALPVGDEDALAGESAVRSHASLLADFQLLGLGVGGQLGWSHRFAEQCLYDVCFRDAFSFGAGLKLPIPKLYPLVGVMEVRGETDFSTRSATAVEGDLGVRLAVQDVTLTAAVGTGLSSGVGTPGLRGMLGVWWTPRDPDSDGDSIPDAIDACPMLPEDYDGFEDDDGCEDPDNDNDMIPDKDDLCPNVAALEGQDEDEDGCTDAPKAEQKRRR